MKILKPINNFIEKYLFISVLLLLFSFGLLLVYAPEHLFFSVGFFTVGGCYIAYIDHKKTQREGIEVTIDFTWMFPKISYLKEDMRDIRYYLDEFRLLEWGWQKLKKLITGSLGLILMIWMWIIRLGITSVIAYLIYDIVSSMI